MKQERALQLIQELLGISSNEQGQQWLNNHLKELDNDFFKFLNMVIESNKNQNPDLSNYLSQKIIFESIITFIKTVKS